MPYRVKISRLPLTDNIVDGSRGTITFVRFLDDLRKAVQSNAKQINEGGGGSGDMLKSVYDTNFSGIVDDAEKVNGLTVETAVPENAVFTDTIYNDSNVLKDGDTLSPVTPTNKLLTEADGGGSTGDYYKLDGTQPITAPFNGGSFKLSDIADGTEPDDGASVGQVDDAFVSNVSIGSFNHIYTP